MMTEDEGLACVSKTVSFLNLGVSFIPFIPCQETSLLLSGVNR